MPFKKILVALDRSPHDPIVFAQALEQATYAQSHLMITHVVRLESDISTGAFMGLGTIADVDTYGTLKRLQHERVQAEVHTAQTWLQSYCQQAIDKGITAEIDCPVGEATVQICSLAHSWGADVIVLGRRGHQGIKEVVLGSVSNYVVHHAPCSVLVVQGEAVAEPVSPPLPD